MPSAGQLLPADAQTSGWVFPFSALAAIWGGSFLFVKEGLTSYSPVQLALGRCALGAASLVVMLRLARQHLPRDLTTWRHLFVAAALFNSIPFTLIAYGETHLSSLLAGLLNAATPLVTLVAARAFFPLERPSRERLTGLLLGLVGVLVVLGAWKGLRGAAGWSVLFCLLAVTCYGVAFPYARRFLTRKAGGPIALAAGQLICATAQLVPFLVVGGYPQRPWRISVVAGMLALGVLGSGVAYVLSYQVLERAGASTASSVTYVIPVFAVLAGAIVLGEQLHWNEALGAAVIFLGVAVSQRQRQLRPTA